MVSYKKLYEEQLTFANMEYESDYKCPTCEKPLMEKGSELYCSDESCGFDKTFDELLYKLETYGYLERKEVK